MGILFIDFQRNLNEVKNKSRDNFFCYTLQEQYETLNTRLGIETRKTNELQELIEACFPTGQLKLYYLSCPNFKREKTTSANGMQFLNNVVIRPELTSSMKEYLPKNTNIILIGDIVEGDKLKSFVVKGIEFIDANLTGSKDKVINSMCAHLFRHDGRPQWTLSRADYSETEFTPDFIVDLIENCYIMDDKNVAQVVKMYDSWIEYLDFRQKYLEQQSLRFFKIDSVELIRCYSINRTTYNMHASSYEELLIVNHDEFKRGEQILLSKKVTDSEEFGLLRINIDYNKKQFLSERIETRGKLRNEKEVRLRAFTRDNLALSSTKPIIDSYDKVLRNSFQIDEKYKLISFDVEPNTDELFAKYDQIIRNSNKAINERYQTVIRNELDDQVKKENDILNKLKIEEMEKHEQNFEVELDSDVLKGTDKDIAKKVDLQITEFKKKELKEMNNRISKLDKKDKNYKKLVGEISKKHDENVKNYIANFNVKQLYIEKHQKQVLDLQKQIDNKNKQLLESFKKNKYSELTNIYSEEITRECDTQKVLLKEQRDREIHQKIEDESIRRFSIFFKVGLESERNLKEDYSKYNYLIYDNRAEKAKIDRQKNALENFYCGNVKNPYLATYLFAPNELKKSYYDFSDWEWFLESLNDAQKDAVQKAVSSRGIFLLQGPPGTGKTQVIAEIIGHLIKDGKKVLVASETHKAIDNVFERLPLVADIRPLRLMATRGSKGSDFSPENLVDNFYNNISTNMKKVIRTYEKFGEYRENFSNTYNQLNFLNEKINRNLNKVAKIRKEIQSLVSEVDKIKEKKDKESSLKDILLADKDMIVRTRRHLERANLRIDDDIDGDIISRFVQESTKRLKKEDIYRSEDTSELIRNILQISLKQVAEELNSVFSSGNELKIEQEIAEVRRKLNALKDDLEEWLPNTEDERRDLQQKLKELRNVSSSKLELSDLLISEIVQPNCLTNIKIVKSTIEETQEDLFEIRNKYYKELDGEISKKDEEIKQKEKSINVLDSKLGSISESIKELQNNEEYASIQDNEAKLRREIARFIEEFGVPIEYKNFSEALLQIQKAYNELDANFKEREIENKKTIPVFKKISDYLIKEELIEEDRREYTKPLFDKVNLFGITCTSRDNFSEKSMDDLEKYNLGSIDIKRQGIDVVIVDEVSKSSFLELLIPILYGKTVILVGDHRQLPPMYEFRNLRDSDFENIDEDILTKSKNDKYTKMYEECYFKTLFEKVPDDYKVMLTQQYRSHEHIMQVYNCFYNNKLQLGKKGQNSEKEHHLNMVANGRTIIEPDKHIYFINCKKHESRETDSTSIYNSGEADAVIQILKMINQSYKDHPNFKPEISKMKDERMSVGVICTYGDQARVIKQKIKQGKHKFGMFNDKSDSKLVISTVDDFQGDERDIIVLSMVRNPQNRASSNPGFITAYQRINVALSRARRLLIVVGNRSYLEDKGVIDLPDVDGHKNDQKNFKLYREVIGAIQRYGRIFDDEDILVGG